MKKRRSNEFCRLIAALAMLGIAAGCSARSNPTHAIESTHSSTNALASGAQSDGGASLKIQVATWPEAECELSMTGKSDTVHPESTNSQPGPENRRRLFSLDRRASAP
jgi:hypothetical protein